MASASRLWRQILIGGLAFTSTAIFAQRMTFRQKARLSNDSGFQLLPPVIPPQVPVHAVTTLTLNPQGGPARQSCLQFYVNRFGPNNVTVLIRSIDGWPLDLSIKTYTPVKRDDFANVTTFDQAVNLTVWCARNVVTKNFAPVPQPIPQPQTECEKLKKTNCTAEYAPMNCTPIGQGVQFPSAYGTNRCSAMTGAMLSVCDAGYLPGQFQYQCVSAIYK